MFVKYFLNNRRWAYLLLILIVLGGVGVLPHSWQIFPGWGRPITVDLFPNIGDNQQIVLTRWSGRAPEEIEQHITYPLTAILLGMDGVRTVRSSSMFGASYIYVIFEEHVGWEAARNRIVEKLYSLSPMDLPQGVRPILGPNATSLGQIFWYTLRIESDRKSVSKGAVHLQELRTLQDTYIKPALESVEGVAEVASIGGFVKEYHIDLNPHVMRAQGVGLGDVLQAIQATHGDVGAETLEINKVEYFIRGLGEVRDIKDIEEAVVLRKGQQALRIKDVAVVQMGPAARRGILDKNGEEVVGGVVVGLATANPAAVIERLHAKIQELHQTLPAYNTDDEVQIRIRPFYSRSTLIDETLGTLKHALLLQILITLFVLVMYLPKVRLAFLVACILPLSVLMVFMAMYLIQMDANLVALSGIVIAIGTMVDLGIVLCESVQKRLKTSRLRAPLRGVALRNALVQGVEAVKPALNTACASTLLTFLPILALSSTEGKLFRPLALTKSFALGFAWVVSFFILPTLIYALLNWRTPQRAARVVSWIMKWSPQQRYRQLIRSSARVGLLLIISLLLSRYWSPLVAKEWENWLFVICCIGVLLGTFYVLKRSYTRGLAVSYA